MKYFATKKNKAISLFSVEDVLRAAQRGQDFSIATADTIKYDSLQDLIFEEFIKPAALNRSDDLIKNIKWD